MQKIKLMLFCCVLFLFSCEGNCPNETVEKIEWVTTYKKVKKDTLVNYRILKYKTEFISQTELKYKVTVANTNNTYNNKFYINFYQYIIDYQDNKKWKKVVTDTVLIKPSSSHTFEYTSNQASKFSNFENAFYIHQIPDKYELFVKKDSLARSEITLNSCETNIEAFKREQESIKNLFNEKSINNSDVILKENWNDGFKLNNLAWRIYENTNDVEKLKDAVLYVERAIAINQNYYNLDTYTALLFKTNNFNKANKIGREAIKTAKRDIIDYNETTKLMRKFNAKNK